MIGLFRALGSAVIIGAGVKAGGELYTSIRNRFAGDEAAAATPDSVSPIDEILSSEEDADTKETRLKEERTRINKELDKIRRARAT